MTGRRPFTRLGVAGLGAHVFYELAAGVGMPLASVLGPTAAAGVWGAGTVGGLRAASRWPASRDGVFAAVNALGLAAVLGHLASWPRTRRFGLPWLRSCEGMGPELMPAYNVILDVSALGAAAGLLSENRRARRRWALAGLALAPVLAVAQHAEHRALTRRAHAQPGWWNRRLVEAAP